LLVVTFQIAEKQSSACIEVLLYAVMQMLDSVICIYYIFAQNWLFANNSDKP